MGNKDIVLSGKNIVKDYGGNIVLNGLDIDIYKGDFTVVMGASGSGKSTLLHILSGMDSATSGEVFYKGRNIQGLKEKELALLRGNSFGFVFQKTHLVKSLTLYENIFLAGIANNSLTEDEARTETERLLQKMGISGVKEHMPSGVSGGEAQRAAVARAVIGRPGILFADEPTGALNKSNTREVLDLLAGLYKEGQDIVLVTHDKDAALRGNRIIYIEDGAVISELKLHTYQGEDKEREKMLSDFLGRLNW